MVCDGDYVFIVFHHKDCISFIPKLLEKMIHTVDIPWMHPGTGFVKDIGHPGQTASHIPDQLQPLGLPAGQGGCFPVQMQIRESNLDHPVQSLQDGMNQQTHCLVRDLCQDFPQESQLHLAHVCNRIPVYSTVQSRLIQPSSMTVTTFYFRDQLF